MRPERLQARAWRPGSRVRRPARPDLPRRLRAQLALCALNYKFGPQGWRVFATSAGRLQAVTTTAQRRDYQGRLWTGLPDAVDTDSPRELAEKLRRRR